MHRVLVVLAAALAAAALAAAAGADAVYHTAQVPLEPVAGAPGGGLVVNIHANGPTVFAHEVYLLQHAAPGSYQVTLHVFPSSTACAGASIDIPTATLDTNAVGNGKADVMFAPADADGLHGLTVGGYWTVVGPAAYRTECSVITLD